MSQSYLLHCSGSENKVAAGMIDIQVELFPKTKQTLSNEVITAQVRESLLVTLDTNQMYKNEKRVCLVSFVIF